MAQKPTEGTHFTSVLEGTLTPKEANYTVVVNTDSGKTFTSYTDAVVFTLPAIAAGEVYTFINTGDDGTNTLTISPNASDGINYVGSKTDNKDIINTKATSKKGDRITLCSFDDAAAWDVSYVRGVWAKEAA